MATTLLHPDVALISKSTKQGVLVESAATWEDQIEEPNQSKRIKYTEPVTEYWSSGWTPCCEPV